MTLSQLLSTVTPVPNILYRPTPIRPSQQSPSLLAHLSTNPARTDQENVEIPLDLSQTASRQSVIQIAAPQQSSLLPTCANPNLNSNWIALKFGAAAGPNRMSYPREFKLMVIGYYLANGQNKYRTCKEFQITKSMLNGWLQKIEKIRQSRPGSLKSGRSGRKPQFPDIEKQLFSLYSSHLESGHKVGNRWIRETARALAREQCSEQQLTGMCQFSERWLSNFKKRYHINLNRDWSSSMSSNGSAGSLDSASFTTGESGDLSPNKNDYDLDVSDADDSDEADSENTQSGLQIQINNSSDFDISESSYGNAKEILNKPGQLPIQTFYERFPWLCRKNITGVEPGRRGRKVQFPDVEKVLYERLQAAQLKGERISNRWVQDQARRLATELCPGILEEATKSARCLFSEHWLHNFKKRYAITLKPTADSQKHYSIVPESRSLSSVSPNENQPIAVSSSSSSPSSFSTSSPSSNTTSMLFLRNWFANQKSASESTTTALQ